MIKIPSGRRHLAPSFLPHTTALASNIDSLPSDDPFRPVSSQRRNNIYGYLISLADSLAQRRRTRWLLPLLAAAASA